MATEGTTKVTAEADMPTTNMKDMAVVVMEETIVTDRDISK